MSNSINFPASELNNLIEWLKRDGYFCDDTIIGNRCLMFRKWYSRWTHCHFRWDHRSLSQSDQLTISGPESHIVEKFKTIQKENGVQDETPAPLK